MSAAPAIGIGVLGYGFMGRAHAHAYLTMRHMAPHALLTPSLRAIAGRDERAVGQVAERFGFDGAVTDWRDLISDPAIEVFDNCGPNSLHAEPTIAAAAAKKHVICEKPLGRDADEAADTWRRVAAQGVVHMCAFNYRFVPAIRLAREMLEAHEIGDVHHFRACYLQDWGAGAANTWRFDRDIAGSGALGDLGAHIVDLARYLAGEVLAVSGAVRTFHPDRKVDDACAAVVEFAGGAIGTLEASRFATGRKNFLSWEINGSKGSLAFNVEHPNHLQVARRTGGFEQLLVTDPGHPFIDWWWPPGHVLGWEHTFVHELDHFLGAVAGRNAIGPHGATFEDGYRAVEICEMIAKSAERERRELIVFQAEAIDGHK